jgi:large subunit ribosomal protein L18
MALSKLDRRTRIRRRIRKKLEGTADCPRLAIFRSNKQLYVQVIDDIAGKTLTSASSREKSIASTDQVKKVDQAAKVGELIAEKCKETGISNVVFDRGGYKYHGRVKSMAEAARKSGLKF